MPSSSIPVLLAAGLLVGLIGLLRGRRRGRAFVEVRPRWRAFLRRQDLTRPDHFLDLSAAHIGGHPGRNVCRLRLTDGETTINAYLKRESHVSWATRLAGMAAGFGFVSRSVREARTLEALGYESVDSPEWLAVGEDGRGRAFLLVRETHGATELRDWLGRTTDAKARLRLARSLGAALAHMHAAGFTHPDLYSKHVLVGADGETVQFLDWQRSHRRLALVPRRRARDLAPLHATLPDDLVRPRERMVCLRAYEAGLAVAGAAATPRQEFLRLVLHYTRRRLRRRHVREKRQPPLARGVQEWTTLHGGTVCVAPALAEAWPGRCPEWLTADEPQADAAQPLLRRWLTPAEGPPALLVRRRRRLSVRDWWRWLRGKPPTSPEQRQAALLLRLERHAIVAPRVLAMGRRRAEGRVESFVLTQPAASAMRLTVWASRQLRQPGTAAQRRRVLAEAGAVLRRLHDAACYLNARNPADLLGVLSPPAGPPTVLVTDADGIGAARRQCAGRARRDRDALDQALADAGCGDADRRRFLTAYRRAAPRDAAGAVPPGRRPGRLTAPRPVPQGDSEMSASPLSPAPAGGGDSIWTRLFRGGRRLREQHDWARFAGADWPDRIMDVAVTDRFNAKQGRSTGRWILHAEGAAPGRLAVYLKRHYRLPWLDGLRAALWPDGGWSAAFQEWDHLEWARSVGVPVPRVVGAAEYLKPWGRLSSFLAVEELHDMLPLNEALPLAAANLAPDDFRRWKRGLIVEMARVTRLLHDRRRFHKDLYLCHFYIARADTTTADPAWRDRVFLIDLHRLGRHPRTWPWWRLKDLAQLLYSTEIAGVNVRDRLAFWRAYRGPGSIRRGDRWLMWLVLFKWRRYRRHNKRQMARESAGASRGPVIPSLQGSPGGSRSPVLPAVVRAALDREPRSRESLPLRLPPSGERGAMNIAFCYDKVLPHRGGCETYIASLARRLALDGHQIHLYARRWDASALPAGMHYHPIVLPSCPRFLRPWFFGAAVRRELEHGRHDVAVGFDKLPGLDVLYPQGGLYGATAEHNLLKYRSPLVRRVLRVCKALDVAHQSFLALERNQYLATPRPLVIAISEMVRTHFRLYFGMDADDLRLVRLATDPERFEARDRPRRRIEYREKWGAAPTDVVALFAGMNYRLKGLEPLLHAVRRMGRDRPFLLLVAGSPKTTEWERLARKLGVADRVRFIGYVSDMRNAYFAADFFVHPTFYDPCSNVVLEAMACGLPVVTTRYNGACELLHPPQEGYVIDDPHDHERLAACLTQLLDPARRSACAQAARRTAAQWTFEHHYRGMLAVFAEAAARKKQAA